MNHNRVRWRLVVQLRNADFMELFGRLELLFTATLWILTVCLTAAVWANDEGERRVIGALQPVRAVVGDDVVLPCHLEPPTDLEGATVEWSKPDLKPDPSDRLHRVSYVHLYRSRKEIEDMKIRSYLKRTSLSKDGLRRGDISLRILNVTLEDGGRYKCFIPRLKSPVRESVVELIVEPASAQTWTVTPNPRDLQTATPETNVTDIRPHVFIALPLIAALLLLLLAVFTALQCKKENITPKETNLLSA